MLELSTLGLLQREPLHGYRLKQQLELFMSSCISINYGAIYPLLRRLEERGDIATLANEEGEAGSNRKIYCITAQGKAHWHEEMLAHPHESWVNSRSRFAIKFFFFSYLEHSERIMLLEHRLSACQLRVETIQVEYQPLNDPYQESAYQRCISVINSEIEWLREQLAQEQKASHWSLAS